MRKSVSEATLHVLFALMEAEKSVGQRSVKRLHQSVLHVVGIRMSQTKEKRQAAKHGVVT